MNLCLLILNCLIFESNIDGAIPSLAAAPFWSSYLSFARCQRRLNYLFFPEP